MSERMTLGRVIVLAIALVVLATSVLVTASPAEAAPLTAADFAADCNADGQVLVAGTQRYKGGTGVITGDCSVIHAPGAKLVVKSVDLQVTGNLVAISSKEDATIKIVGSNIIAGGFLELTAGCCGGFPDGPEENGTVIIKDSNLSAQAIQLLASFDYPDGTVIVRRSQLDASGPLGVQIRASDLVGVNGNIRVTDNVINSGGDILIRTGTTGRTVVRRNNLTSTGLTTISGGGSCVSTSNTPAVACS